MKHHIWILLFATVPAWAISPPTILQIQSGLDSVSIPNYVFAKLTFRNNSMGTTGFLVFRRDSTESSYHLPGTPGGSATTFIDTVPKYSMKYYYVMRAIVGTDTSDESNMDSVVTPAKKEYFKAPAMSDPVWDLVSNSVKIAYFDSSNCEDGYRIHKKNSVTGDSAIFDFPAQNPDFQGAVEWVDTGVKANSWYTYKIEVIKGADILWSQKTMYTLSYSGLLDPRKTMYSIGKLLSVFPIKYAGWVFFWKDSLYIRENTSTDSTYSVINIADPASPVFSGVRKSTMKAKTYYEPSGGRGNFFIGQTEYTLDLYRYDGNKFNFIDSIVTRVGSVMAHVPEDLYFLNDSVIVLPDESGIEFLRYGSTGFHNPAAFPMETGVSSSCYFFGAYGNAAIMRHYAVIGTRFGYSITSYYIVNYNMVDSTFIDTNPFIANPSTKPPLPDYWEIDGCYIKKNHPVFQYYTSQPKLTDLLIDSTKKLAIFLYSDSLSIYQLVPYVTGVHQPPEKKVRSEISIAQSTTPSGVTFQLSKDYLPSASEISVYSLLGKRLFSLPIDKSGRAVWNTARQARGAYLLSIERENHVAATKLVMVR